MKIYFGSDHAGFELKKTLIPFVEGLGYQTEDLGDFEADSDDDYPDFIVPVARIVASDPDRNIGIVLGGSGEGEAMAANRFHHVRAVVFNGESKDASGNQTLSKIKLSREHNNANILSIGARFLSENETKEAVKLWLETPFSGDDRHIRRLRKIEEMTR